LNEFPVENQLKINHLNENNFDHFVFYTDNGKGKEVPEARNRFNDYGATVIYIKIDSGNNA